MYVVCLLFYAIGSFCFSIFLCFIFVFLHLLRLGEGTIILFCHQLVQLLLQLCFVR